MYFAQALNSKLQLLRCTVAAIEIAGYDVDLPAHLIHEVNGISGFLLTVQNRAVDFQMRHQPCVGG